MKMKSLSAISACVAMAVIISSASAQSSESATDGSWESKCKALETTDFSGIQDAPSQVTAAKAVEAAADLPAYCQVSGYVTPNVGFELLLPVSNWNGKLIHI